MGLKMDKLELPEYTFHCTQWTATKALLYKAKLIGVLGNGAAFVFQKLQENSDDVSSLMDGIVTMCDDPEKVVKLIKDVVCSQQEVSIETISTGKTVRMTHDMFDKVFQGTLLDVYKVFFFILKVNFADFLPESLVKSLRELQPGQDKISP